MVGSTIEKPRTSRYSSAAQSARRKGKPKTGGRKAGTPNKATAEIRHFAQQYTTEAINTLLEVMRNKNGLPVARVQAAKEILDRGHGKPAAALDFSLPGFDPLKYLGRDE